MLNKVNQINACPLKPFDVLCYQADNLGSIIGAFVSFLFIVGVVIALFYLLFGALKWIFSGGDKASIESARGTIVTAVIGLIILFLTFLLINMLLGFFNVNIGSIEVPIIPTSAPPTP